MANYFRNMTDDEAIVLHRDILDAITAAQKARARIQRLAPSIGADAKAGDANARLIAKLTAAINELDRASDSY